MVYLLKTPDSDAFDKGAILTPRGFDPWLNWAAPDICSPYFSLDPEVEQENIFILEIAQVMFMRLRYMPFSFQQYSLIEHKFHAARNILIPLELVISRYAIFCGQGHFF